LFFLVRKKNPKTVFPNSIYPLLQDKPITNSCTVYINTPLPTAIKQIWIVKAQFQGHISIMINSIGSSSLFIGMNPSVEAATRSKKGCPII